MNRLSTAGFVPPSVCIGFRLFVLLGKRSGDVSSMLWRVRGRIVPLAHSSVGEQSCPTPPRHPAVRPVATRPWYVRVLDSTGKLQSSCQQFGRIHSVSRPIDKQIVSRSVTCQVQNPDIPRAGPGGVTHGRARKNVYGSARPGDICPSFSQGTQPKTTILKIFSAARTV